MKKKPPTVYLYSHVHCAVFTNEEIIGKHIFTLMFTVRFLQMKRYLVNYLYSHVHGTVFTNEEIIGKQTLFTMIRLNITMIRAGQSKIKDEGITL